jgi:hypothetical protein
VGEATRYSGILLVESLRLDTVVDLPGVSVRRIWRSVAGDADAGQPEVWTFLEFDLASEHVGELADRLRRSLETTGGWYCSFGSATEMVVVFADRVWRYPRGDVARRREVEEHARRLGVPEAQLDWEDWR